mmetsp:Transcript_42106/g.111167  ORF Transcript_42106/g.111167 Transcript_42106/m.111167 type:complete len:608 (-) Transcript_42106:81-1904(-)
MSSLSLPAAFVGCGAGLGALATLWFQRASACASCSVRSPRNGGPANAVVERRDSTILAGGSSSNADSEFLNGIVRILWPRINKHLKTLVEENIVKAIDAALPSEVHGSIKIAKLSIGASTPHFGGIGVRLTNDEAIVMDLGIDLTSDLDVQIKAFQIPLGIRAFSFHGTLTVVLWPPACKPPFFGGFQVYFVNPPDISIDFQGAMQVANSKMIYRAIHDAIMKAIMNAMVIPARIAQDLSDDDDIGMNELKYPEPIGVLRLLMRSARDLPGGDLNLDGTRTSDPYVIVELGQCSWRSKTVHKTTNPRWEHGNVADFLVYDEQQCVNFKVYDEDEYSQDDLLGHARGIHVAELVPGVVDEPLPLEADGDCISNLGSSPRVPAGSLTISSRWFHLSDVVPVAGISPGVAKGPSQLVLKAKIEDIVGQFPAHAPAPFFVRLCVFGGSEDLSATSSASHAQKSKATVTDGVRRICLNLVQQQMQLDEVASITGLTCEQVDEIVRFNSNPDKVLELGKRTNPMFRQTVRLLLPWTADMMYKARVSVEIIDGKRKLVGKCLFDGKGASSEMPLQSIAAQEFKGPFPISQLSPPVSLQCSLSVRWLHVEPAPPV